ncbi:hypothetical protein [Pseudomonas helleri]|uniref:hypothetical protein n=1 Tax=Pseudomonas helleri TaxID=1608996 RepID=UPI003F95F248
MTDKTELKRLADAATQGEWQVVETKLPCRLGLAHIERRIFTVKDHPQLEASYPIVNGSVALGTDETPVHHMVSMTAENAAFIAAANPVAIKALIDENEQLKGLQPAFPPRPPDGDGLPRYGLRWNGPQQPLAVLISDGYWTPWHLAESLKTENEALRKDLESHKRMLLAAVCDLGAIGEALKSDMDADGDELLGTVIDLKAQNTRMLEWLKDISRTSGDEGAVMGARQLLKEFSE